MGRFLDNQLSLRRSLPRLTAPPATRKVVVHTVAMRAVLQRVRSASVEVDGQVVSSIGPGLLCLVGLKSTDTMLDAEFMKVLGTKLWPRHDGRPWQMNVQRKGYEVLMVSQFTLYTRLKGNKPDFSQAMPADKAKEMYVELLDMMKKSYHAFRIKDGVFGAMMNVSLENDGPVTIIVDSTKRSYKEAPRHSESEEEVEDETIDAMQSS